MKKSFVKVVSHFKRGLRYLIVLLLFFYISCAVGPELTNTTENESEKNKSATYIIVDTGQLSCFNNIGGISCPQLDASFYGQDAQYNGRQQSYTDNDDGTITDNVTGLIWEKGFGKTDYWDAQNYAASATTGGYTDWRLPTIKELYSIINFSGNQGSGSPDSTTPPSDARPFIDTDYFDFEYPDGQRYINAQYISSTEYVATVFYGVQAFFGVNFADGRIKGYPQSGVSLESDEGRYYIRLVRGAAVYGYNDLIDNNDGTISDLATGLMWLKYDSGHQALSPYLAGFINSDGSLNWEEALKFAEHLDYSGYNDWRLPNAKELQSIVDYSRAPDITGSPSIDPLFETSGIINEAGETDFPFFWTSTSFEPGYDAIIVQFGRSLGYMNGKFMDVHGAGAQRTDPKSGHSSYGKGPQGDVRRVFNYVRPVRNISGDSGG